MAYEIYAGDTQDEGELIAYLLQLFQSARLQRSGFEAQ